MTEISKETLEAVAVAMIRASKAYDSLTSLSHLQLITAFNVASAAIKAFQESPEYKELEAIRNQVIVLPEGAEPEEGDMVTDYDGGASTVYAVTKDGVPIKMDNMGEEAQLYWLRIIQRNGKPVIQLPKEK